jgi:cyclopropane fatty-acyl-phospholipid synthase-like methyltransferase
MSSFQFKKTPPASPPKPANTTYGVQTTDSPAIANAPLPAEGGSSRSFSNRLLFFLLLVVPYYLKSQVGGGKWTFLFFATFTTIPILVAFWTAVSSLANRINDKAKFPNRGVEHYLIFHNPSDAEKYTGRSKIPMETFHEMYFAGQVSFRGDCLEAMEFRHDWASFRFTLSLFKFFLFQMIPEALVHSRSQDEEQVRDHYDRGDDFYGWFLGERMIYTSGIISDITKEETLEEMQDNKLRVVCEKIGLKQGDTMLDLGSGWGTLAAYASSQYGANVTGITLGRNQTAWGNKAIASALEQSQYKAGVKSEILCLDYRDTPVINGGYKKITCLEMAEHVGVRHFGTFLRQVYEMMDDDGMFFLQIAGLRKSWQFEDLVWVRLSSRFCLKVGIVYEQIHLSWCGCFDAVGMVCRFSRIGGFRSQEH